MTVSEKSVRAEASPGRRGTSVQPAVREPMSAGSFVYKEPMRMMSLKAPFNKYVGQVPAEALEVPSMMSVQERRFLYGLSSRYYEGHGIMVDAGIFLGASTRCFGQGLADNPARAAAIEKFGKPVVSFERAIVNPGMPAFFQRNNVKVVAEPGDTFEPALRANVQPVEDVVDLRVGDILETGPVDHPIEILFLDVLKMTEIADFVVREYFPRLIPGRSVVIQQDYFYERLPFIKTYQEHYREYFEYVGEIGSTAVFLCVAEIPRGEPNLEQALDATTQIQLAGIAMNRSNDPTRRFMMALSKLRLVRKLQGANAAKAYLNVIRDDYPEQIEQGQQYARLREAWRSAEQLVRSSKEQQAKAAVEEE